MKSERCPSCDKNIRPGRNIMYIKASSALSPESVRGEEKYKIFPSHQPYRLY
jgi:ribosomal protein L24E